MKKEVGIIGFGNMGKALAEGLLLHRWKIYLYDKDKHKLKKVRHPYLYPLKNSKDLIKNVSTFILAIKPQDIPNFFKENKEIIAEEDPLLISIAAGISTKFYEKITKGIRVVRVMPNLGIKKRLSLSFICKGKFISQKDLDLTYKIFSCVGKVFLVKESLMDAITAISGSGPGYVYYFMDALYEVALKLKIKPTIATEMIKDTFKAAIDLIYDSNENFQEWIKKVASKKGTTEEALKEWESLKLREIISKGVKKAFLRSKQLSLENEKRYIDNKNGGKKKWKE